MKERRKHDGYMDIPHSEVPFLIENIENNTYLWTGKGLQYTFRIENGSFHVLAQPDNGGSVHEFDTPEIQIYSDTDEFLLIAQENTLSVMKRNLSGDQS